MTRKRMGDWLWAAGLTVVVVAVSYAGAMIGRASADQGIRACDWRAIESGMSLPSACRDGDTLHLNGGQFTYDMRTGKLTDHR